LTATTILSDHALKAGPAFLAFLAVHIIAGFTAVATGAVAALTRKGGRRHIRAGRAYYRAITVVFATATILAAMRWRQDYYLFIIGAIAFTAATIGYQHRRRHRRGDTGHIAAMGTAYVAMLTAFYVDNGPRLPVWDRCQPGRSGCFPQPSGRPSSPARSGERSTPPPFREPAVRANRSRAQAAHGPMPRPVSSGPGPAPRPSRSGPSG
jgi:hypothetical protein